MWGEPDDFGVPANMFGYVPEDFIRALGRIIMLSALVQDSFAHLLARVGRLDTQETVSWRAGQLIETMENLVRSGRVDSRVVAVHHEVRALFDLRNAVAHSMWPFHGGGAPRGWRHPPQRKRGSALDPAKWTELSLDEMRQTVLRLVKVHGVMRELQSALDLT